jgi:hypothetical protein
MDEFDIHDTAGLTRHAIATGVTVGRFLSFRFSAKTNVGLSLTLRPSGEPMTKLPI